jgi:chorismate dehydratase
MLKLGIIAYRHSRPFYQPIQKGLVDLPAEMVLGSPKELEKMFLQGDLDLAFISATSYLRNKESCQRIESLGIGAEDAVGSVKLFAPKSIQTSSTIHLDPESDVSNQLLKWLIKRSWNCSPPYSYERTTTNPHLLIGDACLSHKAPPNFLAHDLGAWWKKVTNLPFLFAPLVAKKDLDCEKITEALKSAVTSYKEKCSYLEKITHILDERYTEALNLFEKEINES